MNTLETNKVNMFNTVVELNDAQPTPMAGAPLFATTSANVKANIISIGILNAVAEGTTVGVTSDTNTLRRIMTQYAILISSSIYSYAWSLTIPNQTLAESVNYQPSDFDTMAKDTIDDICAAIQVVANTNIALLTTVGITAPVVAAFGASINNFSSSIQKPRNAIVSRKTANESIDALIKSTTDILLVRIMDRLVTANQFLQPDFYKSYFSARQVIDLGHTFTKFRGTANDIDGNPLQGALASIMRPSDGTILYKSTTNNIGNFTNVVVTPGDYNIKYECAGKASQLANAVHFAPGSETIHHIIFLNP